MFTYGSREWPIDLTQGDITIVNLLCEEELDEVEVVRVVPGAPEKAKIRGVMPANELEWLKSLSSEARAAFFSEK